MKVFTVSLSFILAVTVLQVRANNSGADVAELSTISIQGAQSKGAKITTDKLFKVPGSGGDPLKAIEAMPGVVLGGNGEGEPAVRGSSPEDNYYQTDHIQVGYLFHNLGNSTYNPNIIEEFSLKSGAWDSQYSNALGAVLDTTLRDPYQEGLTTVVDISFLEAGILVEGAVTDKSAFYASWREGLLDWYFDNINDTDEDIAITQVPKYNDYQFKYHYRLSDTSNLKFLALGARDHVTLEIGDKYEDANKEPAIVGKLNSDGYYNSQGIMYDTLYSGGTSGLFVFSHKEQDFKFKIGTLFDIVTTSDDYRMKMQFETPLNNGDGYRYGAEFAQNIIKYDMSGLYDPCNDDLEICGPASTGTRITLKDRLSIDTTRIFNAYDWMATPYLQLTFGMSNVYDDYLKETTIEPRFESRYELTENWTLTGAVGKHTQTPRDFFAVLKETGNPELDMPKSEHYVTGFEYQLDDSVSAKLEVYYKDLHDLVISNPAYDEQSSPNEKKFLNAAEGHTYGVEFLVNKNLTDKWYGWASVAYSKTKRKNTITDEHFNYSYDRPWIINLVASYEFTPKMTVGAKWRYQSGNLVTPISGGKPVYKCDSGYEADNTGAGCDSAPSLYDPIEGKINSERLSAMHSMDLRIDYQKSEMTNIYFDVKNIYGRQNITDYDYSDDYSTREKVSDLPSLFSLGAKFRF